MLIIACGKFLGGAVAVGLMEAGFVPSVSPWPIQPRCVSARHGNR